MTAAASEGAEDAVLTRQGKIYIRRGLSASAERPPAVLVHGLGGASTNWLDFIEATADLVDAYAPDLPGFGRSPVPDDGDLSVDAQVRALVQLITTLRLPPVHLVGNSLGGAVATRVAAERPDLVRTLTLISPALPHLRPRARPTQLMLVLLPLIGGLAMRGFDRMPPERRARAVLRTVVADPSRISPRQMEAEIELLRERAASAEAEQAFVASLRGLVSVYLQRGPRALWRQARRRVVAPTLVVYGGKDKLVDARLAVRAERTFRRSRVLVIADCGHVAQMECCDVVAAAFARLVVESGGGG